uniref:histone-lysine N-methyltransferase SUVR4-like n=1 Tax=Erigeron canadensis TaxID=72917 RepID=UPI001CB983C7|nr:histone-lysine N-methyltransferase SUVR4-like [Erigeron canadensis]
MAPNPKVAKAFRAMKDIGIPEEKTKPVLKKLLQIYDKNWALIEEENYRALADAIFDSEEAEAMEQTKNVDNAEEEKKKKLEQAEAEKKKKLEEAERLKALEEETQMLEEPERPLKRVRSRHQDDQASPSCISPGTSSGGTLLKKPKLEVEELPESHPKLRSPVKTAVTVPVTRTTPQPVSPLKRDRNKAKQPISTDSLVKPREEPQGPFTDDLPQSEVPHAVIMPESLTNGGTSTENNTGNEPDLPLALTFESTKCMELSNCVQRTSDDTNGRGPINTADESTTELDIASSSGGEIKISIRCDSAQGKSKFSVTHLDMILKKIEDKCLKSYKLLNPNFSVTTLMKDMCECFLDLGSGSISKPPVCKDDIPPTDQPSNTDGSVNGSLPQLPQLPPPSDAVGDPLQPDIQSTEKDCEKQTEQNELENNSHLAREDMRSSDDVNDITKGQENVMISFVNEVNTERLPPFFYIPHNAVFQSAYVNFSLARIADDNCCPACFGNCLTSPAPCLCAPKGDGEFAYTTEGLVKEDLLDECMKAKRDPQKQCLSFCKECPLERSKNEGALEPCKGHLSTGFIKECWLKCGCSQKCGNRVVQRGIKHNLQVFMTSGGKGWGLRTLEDLPKGSFICEYVGEVLTTKEFYNRVSQSSNKDKYVHPVLLDADWGEENEILDDEALCVDSSCYGNVARFINHRCFDANLVEIPVEVENHDCHYYHLAFFTTRNVKAYEELTWDYGIDFDDDHPVKAFQCECGSQFCRNIKRFSRSSKRI